MFMIQFIGCEISDWNLSFEMPCLKDLEIDCCELGCVCEECVACIKEIRKQSKIDELETLVNKLLERVKELELEVSKWET